MSRYKNLCTDKSTGVNFKFWRVSLFFRLAVLSAAVYFASGSFVPRNRCALIDLTSEGRMWEPRDDGTGCKSWDTVCLY